MRTQLTAIVGLAVFGPALHAEVIHVPANAPTIQVAINISGAGDEIVVAPGTYFETVDMLGKSVTLRSSGGAGVTIINALGQQDSVLHCTQGEGPDTVISGFTLRNGDATYDTPEDRGGGIYMNGSSPTVTDCVFVDNDAVYGGAIYNNGGSPEIRNCRFSSSTASDSGGAVYLNDSQTTLTHSTFDLNECMAGLGGAIRTNGGTLTVESSVFDGNESVTFGGAIGLGVGTTASITGSSFTNNFSGDGGSNGRGGAISSGSNSAATITNSVFLDNEVTRYGGALYASHPMVVLGCTLTGNRTGESIGGAYGGTAASTLANLVVWANGSQPISDNDRALVRYCDVEGGYPGEGNIDVAPMFVDVATGDLRLQPGSPAIDAGDTTRLAGEYPVDFDGAARAVDDPDAPDTGRVFLNLAVDMGAHERQVEPAEDACPSDLDDSGATDFGDLLEILTNWGPCP